MLDFSDSDTIAAEATPPGRGGISIIRLSGREASSIVERMFSRPMPDSGSHRFGKLIDSEGRFIDSVVVSMFKSPNSYTGEDVVEVSLHGSPVLVSDALNQIYEYGARPANPGEFTFRAYLNNKIDLTQAEAVADLIDADSREAADRARSQLLGSIATKADIISQRIEKLLACCELELDFVEDDVELITAEDKIEIATEALTAIDELLSGYKLSRRLREGVKVALIGAPNVGKSSLFNTLIGENRAIVHNRPGTTRDVITASCIINGVKFDLFDTAGMRNSSDEIEDEGIRRAYLTADKAEILIEVTAPDSIDRLAINLGNRDLIRVYNKIDLGTDKLPSGYLPISVLTDAGIDELKQQLYTSAVGGSELNMNSISRERHFTSLSGAQSSLNYAVRDIEIHQPTEIVAESLRDALSAIDSLTGKIRIEGILDKIFADFCIGK